MRSLVVESGRWMPWDRATAMASLNMVRKRSSMPSVARMGPRGSWQAAVTGPRTASRTSLFQRTWLMFVGDLGLDAGGAEGLGDGLDAVGDASGGLADGGTDFGVLIFDDAGLEDVGGEPGGAADDVLFSEN